MDDYTVVFQKKNLMANDDPHGDYRLYVRADSLEAAAVAVVPELLKIGMMSDMHDVWNAEIYHGRTSEGPDPYRILHKGAWLVDMRTGRQLPQQPKTEKVSGK